MFRNFDVAFFFKIYVILVDCIYSLNCRVACQILTRELLLVMV